MHFGEKGTHVPYMSNDIRKQEYGCASREEASVSLIVFGVRIMCGSREWGGGGGEEWVRTPPPLKNHKNIGFLSNTDPDPLKNHKATKPEFNVGSLSACQRNAILMAFAGGPVMARIAWYLDPPAPSSLN